MVTSLLVTKFYQQVSFHILDTLWKFHERILSLSKVIKTFTTCKGCSWFFLFFCTQLSKKSIPPFSFNSRFSLAFLDIGNVSLHGSKPSFVHRSSIHHGYNVGVGAFGTDFLEIKNTVIKHTVGPAIQMNGTSHCLIDNLVSYSIAEATYAVR